MATSKLQLYNIALSDYLGERQLASLTENREPRRALDTAWDNDAVRFCLEEGQWKFAQRAAKLTYNASILPAFGYSHVFNIPTDCVKLSFVCTDEFFQNPLLQYSEEAGFIAAELENIYVSYVSNDAAFGGDMSLWPASFVQVVACYLAKTIVKRLTGSDTAAVALNKQYTNEVLVKAKSKDAMQGPTRFLPQGSWVTARTGGQRLDRGNRSRLIG